MSITSELSRIQNAKSAIKTSIEGKGVTVASDAKIDSYAGLIDTIQTGGGGDDETLKGLIEGTLTELVIPSGTTKIGKEAFLNKSNLTSITIPNSVTRIEYNAFSGCSGLASINIPNSVTGIANSAFNSCSKLTSINLPSGLTSIGSNTFYKCTKLTSINIPNSVTSIGASAFQETGLRSVTIPDNVTSIDGYSAFQGCNALTSVTIGNGVTSIAVYTFYICTSLATVIIEATTPPTLGGTNAFESNASGRLIYVPDESVDAYKAATNWNSLADYIKPMSELPSE